MAGFNMNYDVGIVRALRDDKLVLELELALKNLTKRFDSFIGACIDVNGKPQAPTQKDLMRARACLPSGSQYALKSNGVKK